MWRERYRGGLSDVEEAFAAFLAVGEDGQDRIFIDGSSNFVIDFGNFVPAGKSDCS